MSYSDSKDTKKQFKTITHIIMWVIVFSLPYLLSSNYNNPYRNTSEGAREFFYLNSCMFLLWIALFYLNKQLLVDKISNEKKYLQYTLLLLGIFIAILGSYYFLYSTFVSINTLTLPKAIKYNLPNFLLSIAISIVFRLSQDQAKATKQLQQIQQENLEAQLAFLRSQINPHFIFNILNNIVALIRLKSTRLEPTVMQLSSLMQYMLYDTDSEKIFISTEVEYLQNYIDLQQQRFEDKVKVITNINLNNEWAKIEPMLLIPFVENAFKHGVGMIPTPMIALELQVEENVLFLKVRNKYSQTDIQNCENRSGIGLSNVKKRLNLLYANRHVLTIEKKDSWFNVDLQIQLHT